MKISLKNLVWIQIILWLLSLGLLAACNNNVTPSPTAVGDAENAISTPSLVSASPASPTPTNTPRVEIPSPSPAIEADNRVTTETLKRVEAGGYIFQNVLNYPILASGGSISLAPPSADPEVGPAIFLIGENFDQDLSLEASLAQLSTRFTEGGINTSDPLEISVGGINGLQVDLSGTVNEKALRGRIIVTYPFTAQRFAMFGFAPAEAWQESIEGAFEQMTASLRFFEIPQSPTAEATRDLSQPQRVAQGGFSFKPVETYQVDISDSRVLMVGPNADPNTGPILLLFGGPASQETSVEDILAGLQAEFNTENSQVSPPEILNIGETIIMATTIEGTLQGYEVKARVAVAKFTPSQSFSMIGISPVERWETELLPAFNQVLESVTFFDLDQTP